MSNQQNDILEESEKRAKEERLSKPFSITSICRKDILSEGFSEEFVHSLDDGTMEHLASKIANALLVKDFWEVIHIYCNDLIEQNKNN